VISTRYFEPLELKPVISAKENPEWGAIFLGGNGDPSSAPRHQSVIGRLKQDQ
jgi:hypothetical protein